MEQAIINRLKAQYHREDMKAGTIKGEIYDTILSMGDKPFTNQELVDAVMKQPRDFAKGSVQSVLHTLNKNGGLVPLVLSTRVNNYFWEHRIDPAIIDRVRTEMSQEKQDVQVMNGGKVSTLPKPKFLFVGGHPQQNPKFMHIAEQHGIKLKIVTSKRVESIGDPDLIVVCASNCSHSLQDAVLAHKEEHHGLVHMNNCTPKEFNEICDKFFEENPKFREGPETATTATPVESAKIRTADEPAVPEPVHKQCSAECHIKNVLTDLKRSLSKATDKAQKELSGLDITSGEFSIRFVDGEWQVRACFDA